jgi:hypothetical protein
VRTLPAAEYAKDSPDATELRRLHEEIEAKRSNISDMRFETLLSMHDYLDAKQRERLAERIAGKDKHDGKDKDKKAERGEGKPDGKGKDKAERGKGKDKAEAERGKGKPDGKDKDEPESI